MDETARLAAARSANDRIKQQARDRGGNINDNVNFLRRRFVFERMLSRVSAAGYADRWMLKGGVLMLALAPDMHRSTQDIDFTLSSGTGELGPVVAALEEICAARSDAEDGMSFRLDVSTPKTMPKIIGEFRDHSTVRASIVATLHCERPVELRFVVDATAAEIEHRPVMRRWEPTVRGFEALEVPSYPWEVVVAEKLHAVMTGTSRNPRLRDYGDLVVLARSGCIDMERAAAEVLRVFAVRGDADSFSLDALGLTPGFAALRQKDWKGTLATTGYTGAVPASLADTINEIAVFAGAVAGAMPQPVRHPLP